jgi:hypothetical protein
MTSKILCSADQAITEGVGKRCLVVARVRPSLSSDPQHDYSAVNVTDEHHIEVRHTHTSNTPKHIASYIA